MHTEIQKALLPNPTTIVHWKKNHLGAKRQLFSHIGRKINWISNSFSRTYYYPNTYFSIYYKRETKKVIILIHLLSKERPVFSSPTLLQTVFYTETLLVRTLRLFFMVFLIFSPFLLPLLFGILIWVGGVLASSYPSYLFGQNDHSEELNKKSESLNAMKESIMSRKGYYSFFL